MYLAVSNKANPSPKILMSNLASLLSIIVRQAHTKQASIIKRHSALSLNLSIYNKHKQACYPLVQASCFFSSCSTLFKQTSPIINRSTTMASNYCVDERGALNSTDYRLFFKNQDSGQIISPWHDIPLYVEEKADKIFNMVVEIPRWTQEKMEIATDESLSPIKQDVKKGALRYVHNVFPHKGYIWNYGAFPQTWENPNHIDPSTNAKGDNDPIDVIEIGSRVANRGDVIQVKVLGTVALIDEGETDWKIIAIDTQDSVASQMSNINDVEKFFPGLLRATIEWFKIYKIPDGKPANRFAFNGEAKDREFAEKVIGETHSFWKELINENVDKGKLDLKNSTLDNQNTIDEQKSKELVSMRPMTMCVEPLAIVDKLAIDKWHFVQGKL